MTVHKDKFTSGGYSKKYAENLEKIFKNNNNMQEDVTNQEFDNSNEKNTKLNVTNNNNNGVYSSTEIDRTDIGLTINSLNCNKDLIDIAYTSENKLITIYLKKNSLITLNINDISFKDDFYQIISTMYDEIESIQKEEF